MVGKTTSFRRKPPQRSASVSGEGSAVPPLLPRRTNSGHSGRLLRQKSGSVRSILRTTSSDSGDSRWSRRSSDDSILENESEALFPPVTIKQGRQLHKPSFRRSATSSFRSTSSNNSFRRTDDNRLSPGSQKLILLLASLVVALCCIGSVLLQSYFLLGFKQRGVDKPSAAPKFASVVPHPDETHPYQNHNPHSDSTGNAIGFPVEPSPDEDQHTIVKKQDLEPRNQLPPSDRDRLEQYIVEHGSASIRKTITAYTESPLQDTVPGTGSRENPDNVNYGVAPEFVVPLPLRTQTPAELQRHLYPKAKTCHDLPALFPVDRGIVRDESGKSIQWNLGNEPAASDFPQDEAKFCPVELDPFLPW